MPVLLAASLVEKVRHPDSGRSVAHRLLALLRAAAQSSPSKVHVWTSTQVWGTCPSELDKNPADWLVMLSRGGRDRNDLRPLPEVVFQILPINGQRQAYTDVFRNVGEYWVVDLRERRFERLRPASSVAPSSLEAGDTLRLELMPELTVRLSRALFDAHVPILERLKQ
jgi:hypothetical protein